MGKEDYYSYLGLIIKHIIGQTVDLQVIVSQSMSPGMTVLENDDLEAGTVFLI